MSCAGLAYEPPASIPNPRLRARIGAALGKAPEDVIGVQELAAPTVVNARDAGARALTGREHAVNLEGVSLLSDVRVVESLPALESLNLDGAVSDPWALARPPGPVRLDAGGNRIGDFSVLAAVLALRVFGADEQVGLRARR